MTPPFVETITWNLCLQEKCRTASSDKSKSIWSPDLRKALEHSATTSFDTGPFFKEQLQALEVLTGSYSCGTKE
jgi:hypothetical protein